MTYEDQLDEAFKFLVKWKHGSFKYYKNDGKNIGENFPELKITDERDKLQWHLINIGIDEKDTMPIINHLISDGHIEPNWQSHDPKENGNPPNQIKITWKGIMFWDNGKGGYVNDKKLKEEKETLITRQTNSVITTNNLTKLNIGATITFGLIVTIIQLLTCNREKLRDYREERRLNQDTLARKKQERHDSITDLFLYLLSNPNRETLISVDNETKPKDTPVIKSATKP